MIRVRREHRRLPRRPPPQAEAGAVPAAVPILGLHAHLGRPRDPAVARAVVARAGGVGVAVSRPLHIELFAGLSGWGEGLAAAGARVVGFDIEDMPRALGLPRPEGDIQLVVQDVRTLHGRQFKDAVLIVASPPCTEYSYMAMPWSRAKQIAAALREQGEFPEGYTGSRTIAELNELWDACWRIQREASEAAGRHVPMVVENVCGAQPWVGRARWSHGSFFLWGDVPALMPIVQRRSDRWYTPKSPGQDWSRYAKTGEQSPHWNVSATKNAGGSWFRVAHNTTSGKARNPGGRPLHTKHMTNPAEHGRKVGGYWFGDGNDRSPMRQRHSGSDKRKAASALIAKIPFDLAHHIGRVYARAAA